MSRLTVYKYATMAKVVADDHASELDSGTRTSNDDSLVIAKLRIEQQIDGAIDMALPELFEYIDANPALWADPIGD